MKKRSMQVWIVMAWAVCVPSSAQAAAAGAALGRGYAAVESYRTGDVWGRETVDPHRIAAEDPQVARALMAAGQYHDATAFYLGKFAGRHIVATNHHVQKTLSCDGSSVWFPVLGGFAQCQRVYGSWSQVDLALFAIHVTPELEEMLDGVGRNFAFDASIYPGQKLLTAGFGIAGNPRQALSLERDDDCMVFSGRDEFRFMEDPDRFNPADYQTWSFAHGCDISHGDSGSPLIDRQDGAIVGILWTGTIPKPEPVQHSDYLRALLEMETPDETVWHDLNYAVPAPMIKRHLQSLAESGQLDSEAQSVFDALLVGE